ncbi:MAG: hypothetical protein ACK4Q5_20880, partial [Saprospiraceae bacterium]
MTHPFFSKTSLFALLFLALAACGDEAKTDTATDTAAQATGNPELVALTERAVAGRADQVVHDVPESVARLRRGPDGA